MNFEQPKPVSPTTTSETAQENLGGPLSALQTILSEESPDWDGAEMRINIIVNEKNLGRKIKFTKGAINKLTEYSTYNKLREAGQLQLLARLAGSGETKAEEKAKTLSSPTTCDLVVSFPGHQMQIISQESNRDVDVAIDLLEKNLEDLPEQYQQKIQKLLSTLRNPDFDF